MSASLFASWADRVARTWIMDLRQQSVTELDGGAHPRDIWRQVGRHFETATLTDRGEPVALMPDQVKVVWRTACNLVGNCVSGAPYATV